MGKAIVVIIVVAAFAVGGYVAFRAFSRRRESKPSPISIVFLLRAPRRMSEAGVRSAASKAFNVTFDADDPDARDGHAEAAGGVPPGPDGRRCPAAC